MQRIIISEKDLTSNVEVRSSYDVAYVPGFMYSNDDGLEKYYRKPTLFTNKYDFTAKIGSTVPTFSTTQYYPKFTLQNLDEGVEGTDGFVAKAIPDSEVMFAENDADLGYRIALYLLNLGIPVYYEVMNNTLTGTNTSYYVYTQVDEAVTNFNSNLTYYVVKSGKQSAYSVYCSSANFTPRPSFANQTDEQKFIGKIGEANDGSYTFTSIWVDESSDESPEWTLAWKLDDTQVDLAEYGITISQDFVPEYANDYTFTIFYESAQAEEITQENVSPDSPDSWMEVAVKIGPDGEVYPITEFEPGIKYYTLSVNEVMPLEVASMYAGLKNRFISSPGATDTSFDSVGDYSVKYITSGGYPTFEYCFKGSGNAYPLMSGLIQCAANRGDAIALIDHTNNPTRDLYPSTLGGSGNAVIDVIRSMGNIADGDYAAMFTPWYECSHGAISNQANSNMVPGSVAYLSALALQIRDYNPWLAVSGVTRGKVPNLATPNNDSLHTVALLTNNIADSYQVLPTESELTQVSINPITYIRNVGYCLWGNRTLRNNNKGTSALSFLNIRGIVADIKKLIYESCQNNLFEQNTDITWLNFKSSITPLLDRMISNYVLQDYAITRYLVDPTTGEPVPAYKVLAVIRIQPINSIEVFDLTVQLENAEVVVAEM